MNRGSGLGLMDVLVKDRLRVLFKMDGGSG